MARIRRRKRVFKYKEGYHKSCKAGRVFYRSSYELKYYKILDKDKRVISYIVEPFKIPYKFGKSTKNYKPDILVEYADGTKVLIEIKPLVFVDKPKNVAKRKSAIAYCKINNMKYRLVTEKDIGIKRG